MPKKNALFPSQPTLCIVVTIYYCERLIDGMCRICQNNKSFILKKKEKNGMSIKFTSVLLLSFYTWVTI